MEWTKEKPSKPGYYWIKDINDEFIPEIVLINVGDDSLVTVHFVGTYNSAWIENVPWIKNKLWFGPIEPPEKPKE